MYSEREKEGKSVKWGEKKETETERKRERERGRKRCVCVCVCEVGMAAKCDYISPLNADASI